MGLPRIFVQFSISSTTSTWRWLHGNWFYWSENVEWEFARFVPHFNRGGDLASLQQKIFVFSIFRSFQVVRVPIINKTLPTVQSKNAYKRKKELFRTLVGVLLEVAVTNAEFGYCRKENSNRSPEQKWSTSNSMQDPLSRLALHEAFFASCQHSIRNLKDFVGLVVMMKPSFRVAELF